MDQPAVPKQDERIRALLVDDDKELGLQFSEFLKSMYGFEVSVCTAPGEAIDLIEQERFQIVFTDIYFQPPVPLDTVELLIERSLEHGSKVIVLTGAEWTEPPKFKIVKLISKGKLDHLLEEVERIIQEVESQKRVDRETLRQELHTLTHPDWHTETPIAKWLRKMRDTPSSRLVLGQLRLISLRRQLQQTFEQEQTGLGVPSKRQLNQMMTEYLRMSRCLGRGLGHHESRKIKM